MLALTPLRSSNDERRAEMESFSMGDNDDFSAGNLLDDIDFDDLFVGMDYGDVLPDLEIDPEMLAEFSVSGGEESDQYNNNNVSSSTSTENKLELDQDQNERRRRRREEEDRGSGSGSGSCLSTRDQEEIVSKRDESSNNKVMNNQSQHNKDSSRNRKSGSQQAKGSQGKRKVKVDWTPELHRRFVQAVEQLGMDKAVPSRILEIMGIDCLTRHNIASHLQKYRSHQKHLLAREAEAASWSQRRQIYGGGGGGGAAAAARGSNKMSRSDHHHHLNPNWMNIAPTMGFPPPAAPNLLHPYRPLHVWGHPTVDQSSMNVWPKHLLHHSPSPPPPPPHPHPHRWPSDPSSYWHPNHHQRVPNALTPGTPCFPQPLATTRLSSTAPPVVPGIPPPPPHAMYKVDHGIGVVPPPNHIGQSDSHPPPFELLHPTKERIDAAFGDVLSKPWLPLPLGLKPPSIDSVLVELQRQGIPKIPPGTTTTTTTRPAAARCLINSSHD